MTGKRPVSVAIVAFIFMLAGIVGFIYHFKELFRDGSLNPEGVWILVLRILAFVTGLFLLQAANWARWLAIAWMVYHVVLSAFHSTSELLTHLAILIVVSILLFLPKASRYFSGRTD